MYFVTVRLTSPGLDEVQRTKELNAVAFAAAKAEVMVLFENDNHLWEWASSAKMWTETKRPYNRIVKILKEAGVTFRVIEPPT